MKEQDLTSTEFSHFQQLLCSTFELEIKDYYLALRISDISFNGVSLIRYKRASELSSLNTENIKPNEIHFYSKTEIHEIFDLFRHFRNCASHSHRIKKIIDKCSTYLKFIDKDKSNTTMFGIIEEQLFYDFFNYIMTEAKTKQKKLIFKQ